MIVCRNVLLSGQCSPRNIAVDVNPVPFYFPEHRAWWCTDTVYTIVVEAVLGAPTTASLTARFQVAQPTSQGLVGSSNYVDTLYIWADMPSDNGDWPVKVGDETSVNRMTVLRVAGGISHRLVLDPAFTGGASGTADTTSGSGALANVTGTLAAGMSVTGAGLPAGSYIATKTGANATLGNSLGSAATATATATGVAITAQPAFRLTVESKMRGD